MSDFGESRNIIDDVFWVGNAFNEYSFGLLIDSCGKSSRRGVRNPLDANTELLKSDFKLVVGTSIEVGAGLVVNPSLAKFKVLLTLRQCCHRRRQLR